MRVVLKGLGKRRHPKEKKKGIFFRNRVPPLIVGRVSEATHDAKRTTHDAAGKYEPSNTIPNFVSSSVLCNHTMASTTDAASRTPPLLDLTIDNITENVVRINTQSRDARLNYLMERLITHVHDFARETRLSTAEWMAAVQFLTKTGQMCTDVRQV